MNIIKSLISFFGSIRVTVACLTWLFVLTFWGTVAQVTHGLYAAQERYFNSFFFLANKWLPLPGAQLILWILFVNLVISAVVHFSKLRHWRYAGLKMSHSGLLLYFIAAFVVFHVSKESSVHLAEGQQTNLSSAYEKWEIAYWQNTGKERQVTAVDIIQSHVVGKVPFKNNDFVMTVDQFFPNVSVFTKTLPASGVKMVNGSGITMLQPKMLDVEREFNLAGLTATVADGRHKTHIILSGADKKPTRIMLNGKEYFFMLRRLKFPLPFTIRLDKFIVDYYPGTEMARSYESHVTLFLPTGGERQAKIYMNNPLRYKDYTFYQASFDTNQAGKHYSTLAVVKNSGRVLPYIACFVVFGGLTLHFLIMAFYRRKEQS